jgi:hypothetical protein
VVSTTENPSTPASEQDVLRHAASHRPIRVAFLLFYFEAWDSLAGIYSAMLQDPNFEPVVFSMPRRLTGDQDYAREHLVHDFLVSQAVEHIRLTGDDPFSDLERLKAWEPDYVFLNYPWQRNYHPLFRPDNLVKFTRIAYVPYFLLPLVDEHTETEPGLTHEYSVPGYLFEQRTHQLASLVFVQDQATKRAFATTERGDGYVYVSGSPKLDALRVQMAAGLSTASTSASGLAAATTSSTATVTATATATATAISHTPNPTTAALISSVLWAPHHSYSPSWLNFGRFKRDHLPMLDLATRNPEIKFTLRPHPFLFGTLTDRGVLSSKDLEAWLTAWRALANTSIDSDASFVKQFTQHDLLVTDGISFLAEYPLLVDRPGIFIENPSHWEFNELGQLAAACNLMIGTVNRLEQVLTDIEREQSITTLGGNFSSTRFQVALKQLRTEVDPRPGQVAAFVKSVVSKDFASGSSLVDPAMVTSTPWEDRPGREPRDD